MRAVRSAIELRASPREASAESSGQSVNFTEGLFVRIKHCSAEEAGPMFSRAGVFFNEGGMARFLGTGGEVRHAGSDSCSVFTPDKSDYWNWPTEILEALQCEGGHQLKLASCGTTAGPCKGCASDIAESRVHRCEDCSYDLCGECAKKQATWVVGQGVKIRSVGVEEATRVQCAGSSGWADSMEQHLGEVKAISRLVAGRCQLAGDYYWMLGLLEAESGSSGASDIYEEGLYVKFKRCSVSEARSIFGAANETINSTMAGLLGSGGLVRWSRGSKCGVFTPDRSDWWNWPHTMLQPLQCRRNHDLRLQQVANHGCDGCRSDLPSDAKIHRCQSCEFDLCDTCAEKQATWTLGKSVKIRSVSIEEAKRMQRAGPGWNSSMRGDLGTVKQVEGLGAGRAKLDGTWWLLGLLEAPESDAHVEGNLVKIKGCSEDEARAIFRGAGIHWNSSMARFLGSGGEVKSLRGDKCDVYTPDKSDHWTWPNQMLEPLHCRADHGLKVHTFTSSSHRCDGCRSRINRGTIAYRCQGCDFDLCNQCAEKQATWCIGQRVKIQSVDAADAERVQDDGPGWDSSMADDLGETKDIQRLCGGRCQLDGVWWMIGLLDAPGSQRPPTTPAPGIRLGAIVRVRDGVSPSYGWGGVQGEQGEVIEIEGDGDVRVRFPSHPSWCGVASELEVCDGERRREHSTATQGAIRVGSLVQVRADVTTPRYEWGCVSRGERGRVVLIEDDGEARIDFPSQSGWHGLISELELCGDGTSGDAEADEQTETSRGAFPILARDASNVIGQGEDEPQYGGHEEDWADAEAAAQFNCPICLKVCRDAVMHSCRTIFCESCWNFCHASDDRCPACREAEGPAAQAYQQQWDIGKLLICCPRKCGEAFALKEKQQRLPKHLEECFDRQEACPHCGLQMAADFLSQHQEECDARPVCEICGLKVSSMEEHMENAAKEHVAALISENLELKAEVKELQEELKRREAGEA